MGDSTQFACDYAKRKANCKKCKQPIDKGMPRIAKVVPNFFHDGDGVMKQYHHIDCLFDVFTRARATTKIIEDVSEIEGFVDMGNEEKSKIKDLVKNLNKQRGEKKLLQKKTTPTKRKSSDSIPDQAVPSKSTKEVDFKPSGQNVAVSKDNHFREFRRLCAMIADEPSYNGKTNIVKNFFQNGSAGNKFCGDMYTIIKLLLPGAIKRVYNLQSKQLIKLFSQIFQADVEDMMEDLEQGDVSETVFKYFQLNKVSPPIKKSSLTVHDVDEFLDSLSKLSREDEQVQALRSIVKLCTGNDLKTIVRLIKGDLKITAGPKHILDALDPNAHEAFKASRDLKDVIERISNKGEKPLEVRASLMTPVAPMLAEACKSVEQAMKKCPEGMLSEIKYDGERVQLHMADNKFNFFSRSLKPVQKHKVKHFEEYIPKAFPGGNSMILDCEVLLIDTKTGIPLPFGTLGVHKKTHFENANVCLFVFDILHFNGENVMHKSMKERRKILERNMEEIPNRVMKSELKFVKEPDALKDMIVHVIKNGLEGLVLKDVRGIYEPGKRHWLKIKKDYLLEGQMADSADLVVLGAFYGTGNKGGILSVFLMGVYDDRLQKWCTVTKVGNGHDDKTLEKINKNLKTVKISKDWQKVPTWLHVNRQYVPDVVVANPQTAPVWEIRGTEFSKSDAHTAAGISIRFPRVTKIRNDKTWKEATSLQRLKVLFEKSKEESDISMLLGRPSSSNADESDTSDFLSSTFEGTKIYIPADIAEKELLVRYITSYNGDIVDEHNIADASHAVCDQPDRPDNWPDHLHIISTKHLWKCIKSKIPV